MPNYCKLTGIELTDEQSCPLKKMCLNCSSLVEKEDGTYACKNEEVMLKGKEKIMANLPEGFEIDTLTLKPMNLKNPLKKCSNYVSNLTEIIAEVEKFFS